MARKGVRLGHAAMPRLTLFITLEASVLKNRLIGSQIPDKSRKGLGFLEFEGYGPKTSMNVSEDASNKVRESLDALLVEELVSNDKKKTIFPIVAKINFSRPQQQEKPVRKPVKYAEMYSFDHVQAHCNYHQKERVVSGNSYTMVNYNYSAKKTHPSAHRNMVPRAVLMKTGLRSLNTARPKAVNIARPNSVVVNVVRENQTSRNLMEDMLPLGEEPKKGKLLVKELLKLVSLIEDVYFVKELQFNLFSVSQMCDKKNSVLFTDTGCFVLSPDFKLIDESQVFFLASKDETSGILKSFITQIENLVDKKVKIIRCYNGKKFKNRVMSEFCEKKGIKREFSIARTPQQNGVAERRNRTLIKAARTMLADFKLPTTFWAEAVNTA
ncbi:ribonuclease H-like domain-containing protein [Tanacetum coccineum]